MISLNSLENFKPIFSVVSCFVEHEDQILILKRNPDKPQGESWGLPSGKIDKEETELEAIKRELYEEVGIEASKESLKIGKKMFVRYDDYDFVFHTYSLPLLEKIDVVINPKEHSEYKWETKDNLVNLPLIPEFLESMELHYQ